MVIKKHLKIFIVLAIVGLLFFSGLAFHFGSSKSSSNKLFGIYSPKVYAQEGYNIENPSGEKISDYDGIILDDSGQTVEKTGGGFFGRMWNWARSSLKDWILNKTLKSLVEIISLFLKFVVGTLTFIALKLESVFLEIALNLNHQVAETEYVKIGWKFVRDFANLFFGLALILIGISTIIGYEKFNAKKMLPTLIIIALLVNFSFMFCVLLVDFSNVFTDYFYHSMSQGGNWRWKSIGDMLSYKSGFAGLFKSLNSEPQGHFLKNVGLITFAALGGLILNSLFAVLLVIVIGGATILFFIRFAALTMLIILAPIAWVFMILPAEIDKQGVFNKWLGSFIKWVMFAPVMMFFIWLAIFIGSNKNLMSSNQENPQAASSNRQVVVSTRSQTANLSQQLAANLSQLAADGNKGQNSDQGQESQEDNPDKILDAAQISINLLGGIIIMIIFLVGGMKIALEFGVHGAGMVNGWVNNSLNKARVWTKGAAVGTAKLASRPVVSASQKAYKKTLEKTASSGIFNKPGIRWIGNKATIKSMRIEQVQQEKALKQIKALENYTPEQLAELSRRGIKSVPGFNKKGPLSFEAAVQAALMKKGKALTNGQMSVKANREIQQYLPDVLKNYPIFSGKTASNFVKEMSSSQAQNIALVDMIKEYLKPNPRITGTARAALNNWRDEFFDHLHEANVSALSGMVTNVSQDAVALQEFAKKYKESIAKRIGKTLSSLTASDIETYLKSHNPSHLEWFNSNAAKNLGIREMFLNP